MEPITAREWGSRKAAAAPAWSDEKWRRICATLGVRTSAGQPDGRNDREECRSVEGRAA